MESNSGKARKTPPIYESVHVCPKCSHPLNLENLDMKAITTGIVVCPICDYAGPVEITIVKSGGESRPEPVTS